MGNIIKIIVVILFVGAIILVSGCVLHSRVSTPETTSPVSSGTSASGSIYNQSAPDFINQYPPDPSHWIQIDPIRDFQMGSESDSTGLTFNITGTTNLPVNSLLFIEPFRTDLSTGEEKRILFTNVLVPVENKGGDTNTFFYQVTMLKDESGSAITPGEYRIVIRRQNVSNSTGFIVLGKDPLPWMWIRIDPIVKHPLNEMFNITGTTNLPAGSEIFVTVGAPVHSCPSYVPEPSSFSGTSCGNDCNSGGFHDKIPVVPGPGGNNIWSFPVNTTGWCVKERYSIVAQKPEWDNVSSGGAEFRISAE
jgi:hypothetical protein